MVTDAYDEMQTNSCFKHYRVGKKYAVLNNSSRIKQTCSSVSNSIGIYTKEIGIENLDYCRYDQIGVHEKQKVEKIMLDRET